MFSIPLDDSLKDQWKLPLITDYVKKWAEITPDNIALTGANSGTAYTYREFDKMITLYALMLRKLDIKKGDVVVVQWLSTPEFFFLTYACATIGAIMAPLDIRLQVSEVVRDMNKVKPAAFFCMGNTPLRNFTEVSDAVIKEVPSLKHVIQHTPGAAEEKTGPGVKRFSDYFSVDNLIKLTEDSGLTSSLLKEYRSLSKRDPHIIIFTTGTTGLPKAALICNENTITNNAIFSREVGLWGTACRYLNSMPTSHVAGTCQGPMTVWFIGGTVLTVNVYQPDIILEFIQKYRPTWWGGVPTMFHMMWQMPSYSNYDLSSLLYVLYGGSAVDTAFLKEMQKMAPSFGTALGMTECAGYFTATPKAIPIEEMSGQVGQVFPDLAPVTIRKPMNDDMTAGEVLAPGEVGEICVHGPIVFLGYYNDPEATSGMISKDGVLYTGDMGYFHDFGSYKGLKFSGRRKFVIKPKGYLVFPDEVGDYITRHPKVSQSVVVGLPHKTNVDGVFAYVKPKPGIKIDPDEIMEHCKGLASYKRPLHVEIWPEDKSFHLNRVGKIDITAMINEAKTITDKLEHEGKWN